MSQEPMPSERQSQSRKLQIGSLEGYAILGYYADGRPGEVFLTVHKGGSFERGLCHALALVISLALQHGVPAEKIARKLIGLQFEPRGATGTVDIPRVSSFADYLGRWILQKSEARETTK